MSWEVLDCITAWMDWNYLFKPRRENAAVQSKFIQRTKVWAKWTVSFADPGLYILSNSQTKKERNLRVSGLFPSFPVLFSNSCLSSPLVISISASSPTANYTPTHLQVKPQFPFLSCQVTFVLLAVNTSGHISGFPGKVFPLCGFIWVFLFKFLPFVFTLCWTLDWHEVGDFLDLTLPSCSWIFVSVLNPGKKIILHYIKNENPPLSRFISQRLCQVATNAAFLKSAS